MDMTASGPIPSEPPDMPRSRDGGPVPEGPPCTANISAMLEQQPTVLTRNQFATFLSDLAPLTENATFVDELLITLQLPACEGCNDTVAVGGVDLDDLIVAIVKDSIQEVALEIQTCVVLGDSAAAMQRNAELEDAGPVVTDGRRADRRLSQASPGSLGCFALCPQCLSAAFYCSAERVNPACDAQAAEIVKSAMGLTPAGADDLRFLRLKDEVPGLSEILDEVLSELISQHIELFQSIFDWVYSTCQLSSIVSCNDQKFQCSDCKNLNASVCKSSCCCAGETGILCGADCCCCPLFAAPWGPNCECISDTSGDLEF